MPFLKRFYQHFLKILLFPFIMSLFIYIITFSNIALGFLLGTFASILLVMSWHYNMEQSFEGDYETIKLGTITRLLIVITTCLIWYRFADYINIIGVLIGISLSYIIIMYRSVRELYRKQR